MIFPTCGPSLKIASRKMWSWVGCEHPRFHAHRPQVFLHCGGNCSSSTGNICGHAPPVFKYLCKTKIRQSARNTAEPAGWPFSKKQLRAALRRSNKGSAISTHTSPVYNTSLVYIQLSLNMSHPQHMRLWNRGIRIACDTSLLLARAKLLAGSSTQVWSVCATGTTLKDATVAINQKTPL